MNKQILVVKPMSLSPSDKGLLRKAGIVVVEAAEPGDVRLLSAEAPPIDGNVMLVAAMKALTQSFDTSSGKPQREMFARLMYQALGPDKQEKVTP